MLGTDSIWRRLLRGSLEERLFAFRLRTFQLRQIRQHQVIISTLIASVFVVLSHQSSIIIGGIEILVWVIIIILHVIINICFFNNRGYIIWH